MTASWLRENLTTYFSVLRGMANANIHRHHLHKSMNQLGNGLIL